MKMTVLRGELVFVVDCIIGAVAGFVVCAGIKLGEMTRYESEVERPLEIMLGHIHAEAAEKQQSQSATTEKLRILSEGYQLFRNGGPRPETFVDEVLYASSPEGN